DAERHRGAEDHQEDQAALHVLGVEAQALDLAVDEQVADREHFARAVAQPVDMLGDLARGELRPRRLGETAVEALFLRDGASERTSGSITSVKPVSSSPRNDRG